MKRAPLLAPLALLILAACLFVSISAISGAVGENDERREAFQRESVSAAVRALQPGQPMSAQTRAAIEERAGVRGLDWVTDPEAQNGEQSGSGVVIQSVLDGKGRIVGWVRWESERSLSTLIADMMPWWLALGAGLVGVAGLMLWQSRRLRDGWRAMDDVRRKLINEDTLTGLASDRAVLDGLERALATRMEREHVGLLLIDFDGFWELNDTLGRDTGDMLLVAAAQRLGQFAPAGALVGRFGGDKFAVVARFAEPREAQAMAAYFVREMSRPYLINGHGMQIGATAGVACAPIDGVTRDEIVRHGGLALRAAKASERGSTWAFKPELETELHERRFIERELKRALAEQSLDVHYQPVVAAHDSRIVGVEALLRWTHPTRGAIPPMAFVPIAERTGMMNELGDFVLRRAFSDARRWPNLSIAVNLSPVQLQSCSIVNRMDMMAREMGIDPRRVIVEITEGVLVREPKKMGQRLEKLRDLGFRVALDDFGAGYSNLSYLQRLPFDKLKIDGSFVAALNRSANAGVLIQAMVALGRALDMRVLIEGVETEEQRLVLRLAGCDEMQGFLFSRPVPRESIDTLLQALDATGGGLPLPEGLPASMPEAVGDGAQGLARPA